MLRIFGRRFEEEVLFEKKIFSCFLLVFGVNKTMSFKFCSLLGLSPVLKFSDITLDKVRFIERQLNFFFRLGTLVLDRELEDQSRSLFSKAFKGWFL